MSVFSIADRRIHVSDDGWLTRCGIRVREAVDSDDLPRYHPCKKCART